MSVINLTDDGTTSYDEHPTWSPDGKRLAFVAGFTGTPAKRTSSRWNPKAPDQTFNLADSDHPLPSFGLVPISELAWSPDGTKIVFVRGGELRQ